MVARTKTIQELLDEIQALEIRLEEAVETLSAIRRGEVDALVVNGSDGERVFTLEGADHPYRLMVETMSEGAVTVSTGGTLVYSNQSFASMLEVPLERVIGMPLTQYIADDDVPAMLELVANAHQSNSRGEVRLKTPTGRLIPALVSMSSPYSQDAVCIVVTDLSEQKRNEELLLSQQIAKVRHEQTEASRRRINDILESITDSFIAVDREWRFIDVNVVATTAIFDRDRESLIGQTLWSLYPDAKESELYRELSRALTEEVPVHLDGVSTIAPNKWFEAHAYPSPDGLSIYLRDITARKRAEEERQELLALEREARSEAERANRLKDEFLAIVSHELRNPLGAILGWSNVLRARQSEQHAEHALEVIERNARLQLKLIEDLLDVSRIVSGKLTISFGEVDLVKVIEAAIEAAQPAALQKEIKLQTNLQCEKAIIVGDAGRLQQVVGNLLSNGIKFTPTGGTVTVSFELENECAVIRVSDTGEGISEDFLPYVFERFRQQDATTKRAQGGLGLGLAIVRNIVELHHGTVKAESMGSGQGSTFSVILPLSGHQDATKSSGLVETMEQSEDCAALSFAGLNFLLIDDDADGRDFVKTLLITHGARVTTFSTAAEARESLTLSTPDVIICDIGLPSEDGYEFMRRVRASESSVAAVPAVALTAYAGVEDQAKALTAGYQKHLAKPVEPNELLRALKILTRES